MLGRHCTRVSLAERRKGTGGHKGKVGQGKKAEGFEYPGKALGIY